MSGIDGDWTKPAAMAIPKEGYFELERGRYGPLFPRTPACYGFSIIAKVKEGREDDGPRVRQDDRGDHRGQSGGAGAAAAALPALGAVRRRVRPALPVPGHLRHRLRQVHRGRGQLFSATGITTVFTESRRVPRGLEGEPGGVHQVRPRAPVSRASSNTASTRTSPPTRSRRRCG